MDFGILGMNARNMSYIKKFNDKKAIRLADNKEKTKRFLRERGIPVPRTYDIIKSRNALWEYNFRDLPVNEFIIKPVRGSRGRGIYSVKHLGVIEHVGALPNFSLDKWFTKQSPYENDHYRVGDKVLDDRTFRRYLLDILYGKHSLVGDKDEILIEEQLVPGGGFEPYCKHGLADVRIIVFNLIPVAAMLRVPTKASDGKANLDRGALGMGVEVGSGKIYGLYKDGEIFHGDFPEEYKNFAYQTIPYWDEILLYSSKIQYFANLGYIALDWVITDDGPKLLEINARAGLKFQLATQLPIKKRLQKVGDLKVVTPEKGVEIAKTLFSHHKSSVVSSSKLLYLTQHGSLTMYHKKESDNTEFEKKKFNVIIEVDLTKRHNYCSQDIWPDLKKSDRTVLKTDFGVKLNKIHWKKSSENKKNRVVLGRNVVSDYYVKPINKIFTKLDFINPKKIIKNEVDDMHILDQRLYSLSKKVNVSKILKPNNYLEEMDIFISKRGDYNPQFTYNWPSDSKLDGIEEELGALKEKYFGTSPLQSKFAKLFLDKINSLTEKVELIKAYKSQDVQRIVKANEQYYEPLNPELVEEAKKTFFEKGEQNRKVLGPVLKRQRIFDIVQNHIKKQGMKDVHVKFDTNTLGRMSVKKGKILTIKISESARFREQELLATLAHEIDVHVRRYKAGFATGWNILKSGTAKYIVDEEGLAIYESFKYTPNEFEKIGMYQKYYLLSIAGEMSFVDIVKHIRANSTKALIGAFKGAVRIKKGLRNTATRGGVALMKGKVYFEGYKRVKQWIDEGGNEEKLMIGKVKISDLPYII